MTLCCKKYLLTLDTQETKGSNVKARLNMGDNNGNISEIFTVLTPSKTFLFHVLLVFVTCSNFWHILFCTRTCCNIFIKFRMYKIGYNIDKKAEKLRKSNLMIYNLKTLAASNDNYNFYSFGHRKEFVVCLRGNE